MCTYSCHFIDVVVCGTFLFLHCLTTVLNSLVFSMDTWLCLSFSPVWMSSLSIFYRVALLVMNSFSLLLIIKGVVFLSIITDSFARYNSLACRSLSSRVWNTLVQAPWAFKALVEELAIILMGLPLGMAYFFSLAAFGIHSLFHIFSVLTIIWYRQVFSLSYVFSILNVPLCTDRNKMLSMP